MKELNITQAELNKINYNDTAIKQMLTDKQKYKIAIDEKNKILRKREKAMIQSLDRVKKEPRYLFINHLSRFMLEKDITPAMEEKEQEFAEEMDFIL